MDEEETKYCFRCEGLAVIDKGFLAFLPGVLNRVYELLGKDISLEDEEEIKGLRIALREYSILLGNLPND